MGETIYSLGSFAIILDDHQRVLLCHRRDMDAWNLPGGGVERGELPTETVVREVKEETGLEVEVERLVGVYGKPHQDDLVFAFTCRVVGGRIKQTAESSECKYFRPDRLPENTSPRHVDRIHDALKDDAPPVFRRQTGPSTREKLKELGKL